MTARAASPATHLIRFSDLLVLDVLLGPLLEESFFRGCLLPVVGRTTGPLLATLVTALLFGALHPVHRLEIFQNTLKVLD